MLEEYNGTLNLMEIKQFTFLIIVRLDTIDRLENILSVVKYLSSNFVTNIWVAEYSSYNNGLLEKLLGKDIRYTFQEDHDPILYRTKFLNQMTRSVETPYVAVWDTDVIVPVSQIIKAVELLVSGEADFVYPYERQFLDTTPILRKLFFQERNIEVLEQNVKKMIEMYLPNLVGGTFFANQKAYQKLGLENEGFYGWGSEDLVRYNQWDNMGYKIRRVEGPLFHLSHERKINRTDHNDDQKFFKMEEVNRIGKENSYSF